MVPLLCAMLTVAAVEPPDAGEFTVASRDWAVTFAADHAWSIHHIDYRGALVVNSAGANGTAVETGTPVDPNLPNSWIGGSLTGGGREQKVSVGLSVDGKETFLRAGRRYEGAELVVTRESRLADLEQTFTVIVTGDRVVEHVRLRALRTTTPDNLYLFMHNWELRFSTWAAGSSAEDRRDGHFDGRAAEAVAGDARWYAVYDPVAKLGVLTCHPRPVERRPGARGLVNWQTPVYHKQYYAVAAKSTLEKGTAIDQTCCLRAFASEPDGWALEAEKLAAGTWPPEPAAPQPAAPEQGAVPAGILGARVGDWTVWFDPERCWTIHHLDYRGRTLSHEHGFHGLVIATGIPKTQGNGSSFVGTGHTEGGREQVEGVELSVDGRTLPAETGRLHEGRQFRLVKHSRIDQLVHVAEITITPEAVFEHHRVEAVAEQPLKLLYAFMHCWQPSFTLWAAADADGKELGGKLESNQDFDINTDVRWSALYDETARLGVVTSYPEVYRAAAGGLGTRIWDLDRYHKQYLHLRGPGALPAGFVLDCTLRLQAFTAAPDGWVAAAKALAESPFPR
ncbi:MAG: hypothetical protein HYU66_05070 [Armatimonadetes bacterium]|nr:hypothetical protein [Armatimonadota bacterium]